MWETIEIALHIVFWFAIGCFMGWTAVNVTASRIKIKEIKEEIRDIEYRIKKKEEQIENLKAKLTEDDNISDILSAGYSIYIQDDKTAIISVGTNKATISPIHKTGE